MELKEGKRIFLSENGLAISNDKDYFINCVLITLASTKARYDNCYVLNFIQKDGKIHSQSYHIDYIDVNSSEAYNNVFYYLDKIVELWD